jgi:hypothetical protein
MAFVHKMQNYCNKKHCIYTAAPTLPSQCSQKHKPVCSVKVARQMAESLN